MQEDSQPYSLNIWPGFVDVLSSILMVVLFAFMVFIISQFYLSSLLGDKNKNLVKLQHKIKELESSLTNKQHLTNILTQEKEALYEKSTRDAKTLQQIQLSEKNLQDQKKALETLIETLRKDLELLKQEYETIQNSKLTLDEAHKKTQQEKEQLALSIEKLKTSEAQKQEQVQELDARLQTLLAERVKELSAYRSEFFGKLRKALGDREDIRITGDRFIFQSEVLFDVGSAELGENGKEKIAELAEILKTITKLIPSGIDWILRIDGHTDALPLRKGAYFESNWDLSTARAISVVKFLIEQGIAPNLLAAAGFGEFHPLVKGMSEDQRKQNRRIELILDQKRKL